MCKYCEKSELMLKEKRFELSIVGNELFLDTDNSLFDDCFYIEIAYCPICGKKLMKRITLETIDEIMEKYLNNDTGEFDYKGIKGKWELADIKMENDNKKGDIEQYIFNITIFSIGDEKVNHHCIYKLNNLGGANELY